MNLLQHYSHIADRYPAYVTQQQMCEICGISKSTAYKLERQGTIPHTKEVNRLLHTHKISLLDILAFKYEQENGYKHDDAEYIAHLRQFYENMLRLYPDVLLVKDVSSITGFVKQSIERWIYRDLIRAFTIKLPFRIPKVALIDFLVSPYYNGIRVKSKEQREHMNLFSAWYSGQTGVDKK